MSGSSRSSGLLAASALVATGRQRINAITLVGGAAASSVILSDNTVTGGLVVGIASSASVTAGETVHIVFERPVIVENGIYATLAGVGANCIVFYGG
jgi:hypothetical protein